MSNILSHPWLLPEYIEDVLPREAQQIEQTRRKLLDLFRAYGYRFVIPPMLEYLESLNAGIGNDLDTQTFKVVDQLSGRLMGIRADITPQAARIDAQRLNQPGVTRLCYAGSVLRTLPDSAAQTRQPLQLGTELFGHAGLESDLEIQRLMVEALWLAGAHEVVVDFSHVAIFRAIVTHAGIAEPLESSLFAALQAKAVEELRSLASGVAADTLQALLALPELNGGIEVLLEAQERLPQYAEIKLALQDLRRAHEQMRALGVTANFDLADLRGYHYHSGMVFAAYAPTYPGALAMGGRYDHIGQIFGRARPATGFSLDMRALVASLPTAELDKAVLAPYQADAALQEIIEQLRAQGEIVVVALPGYQPQSADLQCDRRLEKVNGTWQVVPNLEK